MMIASNLHVIMDAGLQLRDFHCQLLPQALQSKT